MNNIVQNLYLEYKNSTGISTDSRNIFEGCIFFALKGGNFDGNRFAEAAIANGAKIAVVDDPRIPDGNQIFKVQNTLKTLQELAVMHRRQLTIPVIGITGSNGKTTTKELIKSVLSEQFETFATTGNLNNHIGVPLSILSITDNHQMAIIEMGANHQGEIAALCEIAQPDYGIITNIGKAHLEGFGGVKGVIKAKSELYQFIKKHAGKLFVNADDSLLMEKSSGAERILYGSASEAIVHGEITGKFPFISIDLNVDNKTFPVSSSLVGSYNFTNILAAACIGKYFNIETLKIVEGLASYEPKNSRSQWLETKKNNIILDAYNANPSSMKLALENFSEAPYQRKVVILGDMLELGADAETEHTQMIEFARQCAFEKMILIGEIFNSLAQNIPEIISFKNAQSAIAEIEKMKPEGFTILIKGSRGIQLEKLLEVL